MNYIEEVSEFLGESVCVNSKLFSCFIVYDIEILMVLVTIILTQIKHINLQTVHTNVDSFYSTLFH